MVPSNSVTCGFVMPDSKSRPVTENEACTADTMVPGASNINIRVRSTVSVT
jgi:hypothetical protein